MINEVIGALMTSGGHRSMSVGVICNWSPKVEAQEWRSILV